MILGLAPVFARVVGVGLHPPVIVLSRCWARERGPTVRERVTESSVKSGPGFLREQPCNFKVDARIDQGGEDKEQAPLCDWRKDFQCKAED